MNKLQTSNYKSQISTNNQISTTKQSLRFGAWNLKIIWSLILGIWVLSATVYANNEKVKVLTTLNILKSLAKEVGGDKVEVDCIASPRQDPHYIVPKPTFMKKANGCDIFIELGLSLDIWANDIASGSGNTKIQNGENGRVIASAGVKALELPAVLSREWGDIHPGGNPHAWTDPINAKVIAENIANGLKKIDSANSDYYDKRLANFKSRIDNALFGEELIKEVGSAKLNRLAQDDRLFNYLKEKGLEGKIGGWLKKAETLRGLKIITYHKSWIYFTNRFGIDIKGELEEKPGIPPTAKYRDTLIEKVKKEGIKVIEIDTFYPKDVAEYVAEKAGAKVLTLPLDVGAVEGTDDYFHFINYIIEKFAEAAK